MLLGRGVRVVPRQTDRQEKRRHAGWMHSYLQCSHQVAGNTLRQVRQEGTDKFGWMTAMSTETQLWSCNERERTREIEIEI